MRGLLSVVVLAVFCSSATAKVYERCVLARELLNVHGFQRSELSDCELTYTLN